MNHLRIYFWLSAALAVLSVNNQVVARHYFVNSVSGNDAAAGTEPGSAWKSLAPVHAKDFMSGDTINFMAGSSWDTGLDINDSGTPQKPIIFRAVGEGPKPMFSHPGNLAKAINITGKWVVVDGLFAKDAHLAGVYLEKGADHNIIRNCEIQNCGGGVMVHSRYNLICQNYAHDLIMVKNTQGGDDDYGAVAYWVFAPNNEIAYNRAVRCRAQSYDYGADGGFFEVYTNGDSTYVHHNYAEDCNGFLEIGGGSARDIRVSDNVSLENGEWTFHLTGKFRADIHNFRMEHNTIISRKGTKWNNLLGVGKGDVPANELIFSENLVVLGGEAAEKVARHGNFIHHDNTYFLLDGAKLGFPAAGGEQISISR
ncbi:polysaccharide lyase domain-containing protein [Spirosoma aerolatum]|uniref:hemolysin-type calcium-binding region n=1 Tax=Spirosoma aerolatum TaxID=1211326 RepID=UPI0009ABF425|nr:hemolysin-type calcium-binding region [Spirosoma aerolatum]